MPLNYNPIALIILDGFGIAPSSQSNAVALAKKPFFDLLIKEYPSMLLQASGLAVGLPMNEVGNSEVGHLTIGSGILRYQSLPRINKSISTGQFFKLTGMQKILGRVKKENSNLHIIGMIGNGGIHSSQEHLMALINFAKTGGIKDNTYLHLFLDGRDTAKDAGKKFLSEIIKLTNKEKTGQIASMGGRYYGMDRNKNWDRIQKAYEAIVNGQSEKTHSDPIKTLEESYANKIFDEEIVPTVMVDKNNQPITTIKDGDSIIFFNFRADRARQLTESLVDPKFKEFKNTKLKNLYLVTFTEYKEGLPAEVLFPKELIETPLAKIFSDYNIKQLHVAETEKYAHITFFLNGMEEEPFAGEERILVPSPSVTSYDQKPEMSADEMTNNIIKALKSEKYGFMAINYANPDMVGHTGDLKKTIKAIETVDDCLSKIVPEIIKKGGIAFIISDHGNSEEMFNITTGQIDKEHNMYPVPFIVAGNKFAGQPNPEIVDGDISLITPAGILSDVAPTILKLAGLKKPSDMTGTSLL